MDTAPVGSVRRLQVGAALPFAPLSRLWRIYNDPAFRDRQELARWIAIEPLEHSFREALRKRLG